MTTSLYIKKTYLSNKKIQTSNKTTKPPKMLSRLMFFGVFFIL